MPKITPAEYPQIHFTISSDETTNPDAGKSWRWVKEEDGTYKWTPIADSDAVKALQEAARAQDTADAKRRVFVVTPTTPYDVVTSGRRAKVATSCAVSNPVQRAISKARLGQSIQIHR